MPDPIKPIIAQIERHSRAAVQRACLAQTTTGHERVEHLRSALVYADEITKAAADLRAEIERIEAEKEAVA